MKKNIAIYAGTFDPLTFGHLDIIERGARFLDQLIIGVAESPSKKPLFSLDERLNLLRNCASEFSNVEVVGFKGLLVDFAHAHHANLILRGIRDANDFSLEFQLASMNKQLSKQLETLFLVPTEKYMAISATLVREIAALNGDVKPFVPEIVANALAKKFKK